VSELAFTVARLGFLALLWFFVFLVVRALRHDTAAEASAPAAPRRRLNHEPASPAPQGRRRGATRLIDNALIELRRPSPGARPGAGTATPPGLRLDG